MLATTEHEWIHDLLARQTTHGYVLLLLNLYLKDCTDDMAVRVLDWREEVFAVGEAPHEMYALYGTLKSSEPYEQLLPTLPPDYAVWLAGAEVNLKRAVEVVLTVPERLARVRQLLQTEAAALLDALQSLTSALGYTAVERALPVYFEAANDLERVGGRDFEDKEAIGVTRDAIAPGLRSESRLTAYWGTTEGEYGRLHQLFQENIHSGLFNFPGSYARQLIRTEEAFNRVLEQVEEQGFRFFLGGYATDRLSEGLAATFRRYVSLAHPGHI